MNDKEKKAIEKIEKQILIGECEKAIGVPIYISDLEIVLNIIENQKAEIEKKDKIIDLMAKDKYENINMLQMANIGKEVNYDPIKLFNGIPDEEAIKIIKQYFEKKSEEEK